MGADLTELFGTEFGYSKINPPPDKDDGEIRIYLTEKELEEIYLVLEQSNETADKCLGLLETHLKRL